MIRHAPTAAPISPFADVACPQLGTQDHFPVIPAPTPEAVNSVVENGGSHRGDSARTSALNLCRLFEEATSASFQLRPASQSQFVSPKVVEHPKLPSGRSRRQSTEQLEAVVDCSPDRQHTTAGTCRRVMRKRPSVVSFQLLPFLSGQIESPEIVEQSHGYQIRRSARWSTFLARLRRKGTRRAGARAFRSTGRDGRELHLRAIHDVRKETSTSIGLYSNLRPRVRKLARTPGSPQKPDRVSEQFVWTDSVSIPGCRLPLSCCVSVAPFHQRISGSCSSR